MDGASILKQCGHKNGHNLKIGGFLAAQTCSKLLILLAPQVGLEPTTLRLTAECFPFLPLFKGCPRAKPIIPKHIYLIRHIQ
jgi:hypothetical protein